MAKLYFLQYYPLVDNVKNHKGVSVWFPFLKGGNIFCKGDYLTCDITTGTLIGNFDPVSANTQKGS